MIFWPVVNDQHTMLPAWQPDASRSSSGRYLPKKYNRPAQNGLMISTRVWKKYAITALALKRYASNVLPTPATLFKVKNIEFFFRATFGFKLRERWRKMSHLRQG
jgi:hypothetical protein